VLPSVRGNPLREWIMGTQAERLIRLCRSPVLVVKRPALAAYRRVLVPLDIEEPSVRVLALAASLSRGPRLEVLHAIGAGDEKVLREVDDCEEALRSYRQHRAQAAFLALHRAIDAAQVRAFAAEANVEFGEAGRVVLARTHVLDAELVVMGKAQRGLLAGYFLGGLTQCMLARGSADVLVHPDRGQGAAPVHEPARQAAAGPVPFALR
jgi:nucleotide-binding universal stress UspA family protein